MLHENEAAQILCEICENANMHPTEVKEETTDISKVPSLYLLAQEKFANKNALSYFLEVYEFIDKMDKMLLDLYPEVKEFVLRQSKKY